MGTAMDIPVTVTGTVMDIPNAVTDIRDARVVMPTTVIADASIIVGLAAIARRVTSAGQSVATIASP